MEVVYRAVRATLKAHDAEVCEVSVLLTDDNDIRNLNRDYRKIDEPTDVLAFAMREGEDNSVNPNLLGDIVISLETAARQAATVDEGLSGTASSIETEVAMLSIHGVLHLLGYDHQTQEETTIMFEKQKAVFSLLQVPSRDYPPASERHKVGPS